MNMHRWFVMIRLALLITLAGAGTSVDDAGWHVVRRAAADMSWQGAITLPFDQMVTGFLDDETFRRVYMFAGQADEVIAISMTRIEGDLDPYLLLTDEQGNILALSDDNGMGTDALIESKRVPADGRYFVIATRFGQGRGSTTGEYALLLERVGGGATQTTVLRYGSSVLGRVTPEKPLVFFFLRAERGDVINIRLRRTSGDLDPHLDLATTDGLVLLSNDDDPLAEGTLDAGITHYTVQQTGVYLIVATRFGRESGHTQGSFVLTVAQTPPDELGKSPEDARLIDYGATLEGVIDDDVPARYYRFEGQRGDVITVAMVAEEGNLDPMVKVIDVNLFGMAQDDNSGEGQNARIVAYSLPADGTYYVVATRHEELRGETDGTYTLQFSGRPGIVGGQALEILYGATVSGVIEDENDSEEYVFFGQRGDVIRIAMERASGDLDALITLLDSDRKQVVFDDDSGNDQDALIEQFELPLDDMYILVASRFEREEGTTSGAYLLTLELVHPGSVN